MYNSRPRRMNYNGYQRDFVLPENYAGNAFRENVLEEMDEEIETVIEDEAENIEMLEDMPQTPKEYETVEAVHSCEGESNECKRLPRPRPFGFNVGKLFSGGIGVEELLIIGLILLIAQSENNEDIIVLLALLLFIG